MLFSWTKFLLYSNGQTQTVNFTSPDKKNCSLSIVKFQLFLLDQHLP